MSNLRQYNYEAQQIDQQLLQVPSNCSGIMFINQNSFTIYVNSFPLQAGATLVLDPQTEGEIDTTIYSINWNGNAGTLAIWKRHYAK